MSDANRVVVVRGDASRVVVVRVPTVVAVGVTGKPGPPGPPGPPGSAEAPVLFTQQIPASVWHVHHGLGYDPAALYVVDGAGVQSWPDRIYVNDNEFDLDWGSVLATGTCLTR